MSAKATPVLPHLPGVAPRSQIRGEEVSRVDDVRWFHGACAVGCASVSVIGWLRGEDAPTVAYFAGLALLFGVCWWMGAKP